MLGDGMANRTHISRGRPQEADGNMIERPATFDRFASHDLDIVGAFVCAKLQSQPTDRPDG